MEGSSIGIARGNYFISSGSSDSFPYNILVLLYITESLVNVTFDDICNADEFTIILA